MNELYKRKKEKEKKRVPIRDDPYEKVLHKKLVKLLHEHQKTHDFVFFHVKNDVGVRRGNFFYDLKPMGVLPGVSDFCFLRPGKIIFLEIKRKKGKLSPSQKDFIESVTKLGHECFVAYGWDEINKITNKIISL